MGMIQWDAGRESGLDCGEWEMWSDLVHWSTLQDRHQSSPYPELIEREEGDTSFFALSDSQEQ